ncbi:MAG TPA: 3-isopropylmalate dehydrogenase [Pyrinomonadaceae bacterium]|jgi:3-isopropylmalate dehydrogenase|nr:3-isopropylmalate dehydrogenase [Pyrinomonadaceae bacterium]
MPVLLQMKLKITILEGDGVGPEVTREAVKVLRAVATLHGHDFSFDNKAIGGAAIKQAGSPLPTATLDACLSSDAVLLGAVGSPEFDSLKLGERPEAGLLLLRRALGGFANLRPAISYDAIAAASPLRPEIAAGSNILIVRELLGGLYFGEPRGTVGLNGDSVAVNTMSYSVPEIERVARVAFTAAMKRERKVTSVDKANVLETSQLWRSTVTRIAQDYPEVTLDNLYVDACAMHLITNPRRFDVLLTENLFGDILSDEAAVITGSLGMLGSATIGGEVGLYEPVHGSAPDIAGQGIANPFGAIASAAMLLRYSGGLDCEADDIEAAIKLVLNDGYRTRDIAADGQGYLATTAEIGERVVEAVAEIADVRYAYHAV